MLSDQKYYLFIGKTSNNTEVKVKSEGLFLPQPIYSPHLHLPEILWIICSYFSELSIFHDLQKNYSVCLSSALSIHPMQLVIVHLV